MKQLIVLAGPTASGKTSLAIDTALALNTEIVSADSRQFFKELTIGTAKPTKEELIQVPHHFINSISVTQDYSAGDYEQDALQKLNELFQDHDRVLLVGGSGLYIKAVTEGFDSFPDTDPKFRVQLNEQLDKEGLGYLVDQLKQADPDYAAEVDLSNPQRVIRALEVIQSSGQKFSTLRKQNQQNRPFEVIYFGIDWSREQLYERINQRVDLMVDQGLENEVKELEEYKQLNALQTVGYSEFFDYFDGKITRDQAIELIKRNTRRYAKRQLTWFRRIPNFHWLKPGEPILTHLD